MNRNTVNGDIMGFKLRQLGATDIKAFTSRMHIVNFNLGEELVVTYVFNITKDDKYFLQRMRPYSMVKGMYADQKEIIEFIKDDIERFKKSVELNDVNLYVALNEKINGIYQRMEHIFLHHNINNDILQRMVKNIEKLAVEVEDIHKQSEIIKMDNKED